MQFRAIAPRRLAAPPRRTPTEAQPSEGPASQRPNVRNPPNPERQKPRQRLCYSAHKKGGAAPAADRGSTASPISLDEAPTGLQRQVLMTRPSLTLRTADVQARSAARRNCGPSRQRRRPSPWSLRRRRRTHAGLPMTPESMSWLRAQGCDERSTRGMGVGIPPPSLPPTPTPTPLAKCKLENTLKSPERFALHSATLNVQDLASTNEETQPMNPTVLKRPPK